MRRDFPGFKMLDYLDHLGAGKKKGEYLCPGCGSDGFKVDRRSGKYMCWKGGCMETDAGKNEVVQNVLRMAGRWVELPVASVPTKVIPAPSREERLPVESGAIADVYDPRSRQWTKDHVVMKESSKMVVSPLDGTLTALWYVTEPNGQVSTATADAIRVTQSPPPKFVYVGLGKGTPMLEIQGSEIRSLVGDAYPIGQLVAWAAPYRHKECLEALSQGETVGWVASEAIADWFWEQGQPATTSLWQGTDSLSPGLFPPDLLSSGAITLVATRDEDLEYLERVEEKLATPCRWFFVGPVGSDFNDYQVWLKGAAIDPDGP